MNVSHFLFRLASRFRYIPGILQTRKELLLVKLLKRHQSWAEADWSDLYRNPDVRKNKTIWVMWTQGLDAAPDLVQKCCQTIAPYQDDYDVVVLTGENLSQYVRLPEHVEQLYRQKKMGEAQHSNIVRAYLLIQYGGIWRDATCYQSAAYPDYVLKSPFFMFSRNLLGGHLSPIIGSNWFIKAEAGNVLLQKTFNYLCEYYKRNTKPHNYYIFHLVMTMLVQNDEACRQLWQNMPYVCNMNPHVFYFQWHKPYTAQGYAHLLNACFIHKLSYKFEPSLLQQPENMLKHLLAS